MSFPDPHHPWDPPQSEMDRIDWREVPLPDGYPTDRAERERILDAKPRHWRQWYDGTLVSNYEAPKHWVPATLTDDQVREINARNAVEVELIDEALGRVLAAIEARGWTDDVDVVFTTDHGELQGDFGLLFKGPYHVDGLMRLPLIWRPAPSAGVRPGVVATPVGLVDLAPTFCSIAGVAPTEWMQGRALPVDDADAEARGFERVLTEWDSELFGVGVHLRTVTRDGWVCTAYRPGYVHDGTEGELYSLADDPLQQVNRWDDPASRERPGRPGRRPLGEPARTPRSEARRRGARLADGRPRRVRDPGHAWGDPHPERSPFASVAAGSAPTSKSASTAVAHRLRTRGAAVGSRSRRSPRCPRRVRAARAPCRPARPDPSAARRAHHRRRRAARRRPGTRGARSRPGSDPAHAGAIRPAR